jgi:hypothetical protein
MACLKEGKTEGRRDSAGGGAGCGAEEALEVGGGADQRGPAGSDRERREGERKLGRRRRGGLGCWAARERGIGPREKAKAGGLLLSLGWKKKRRKWAGGGK